MNNIVRWGIIGAGDVCERKSGPPLYQLPRSALVRVFRRDSHAAADFVQRHGHGTVATTLEDLVSAPDVDAVYVASPHALHAEHTIAALKAGKHVLVEKPMALSVADCDQMIAAAAQVNRSLAVAYYRRGYPSIQRVRTLLTQGAIGTPQQLAINAEFPTSHRIDLVHYLFGAVTTATMEPDQIDPDGYRFEQMMPRISLTTASGVSVTMAGRWTETGMPESLRIVGDTGTIHLIDLKGGALTVVDTSGNVKHEALGGLPWTHWGLIENVVEHALDGVPLLCTGEEGRASTAILEQLDASTGS